LCSRCPPGPGADPPAVPREEGPPCEAGGGPSEPIPGPRGRYQPAAEDKAQLPVRGVGHTEDGLGVEENNEADGGARGGPVGHDGDGLRHPRHLRGARGGGGTIGARGGKRGARARVPVTVGK